MQRLRNISRSRTNHSNQLQSQPKMELAASSEPQKQAQQKLDTHVRETIVWHFSPETGCPFWLDWAKRAGWNPAVEVKSFSDLVARFPHFQDEWLRDLQ